MMRSGSGRPLAWPRPGRTENLFPAWTLEERLARFVVLARAVAERQVGSLGRRKLPSLAENAGSAVDLGGGIEVRRDAAHALSLRRPVAEHGAVQQLGERLAAEGMDPAGAEFKTRLKGYADRLVDLVELVAVVRDRAHAQDRRHDRQDGSGGIGNSNLCWHGLAQPFHGCGWRRDI